MPGNREGGLKASATILARNPNHYKEIGKLGGSAPASYPKGFAANRELARMAGVKGGRKSVEVRRQKRSKMKAQGVQWQNQNSTVSSSTSRATKLSPKSDANSSSPSKSLIDRLRRLGR